MTPLLQVASFADSHAMEAVVVGVIVGAGKIFDHVKGKRRDHKNAVNSDAIGRIERGLGRVARDVADVTGDVRDLKAWVVGPDGQNGIRGDVREIKERVVGLEDRERDRLHGPYTKRA